MRALLSKKALEIFETVSESHDPSLNMDRLQGLFKDWLRSYQRGKWGCLKSSLVVGKYFFKKLLCRFSLEYREQLHKKLGWLNFVLYQTFITLTVDSSQWLFVGGQNRYINWAWARLRANLYKRYGKFQFLKILEVTLKGRPHLHVLCTLPWIDVNWLRALWVKYCYGREMYICSVKQSYNALSYVLKYVTKSFNYKTSLLYGTVLWCTSRRLYTTSRHHHDAFTRVGKGEQGKTALEVVPCFNLNEAKNGILEETPLSNCNSEGVHVALCAKKPQSEYEFVAVFDESLLLTLFGLKVLLCNTFEFLSKNARLFD